MYNDIKCLRTSHEFYVGQLVNVSLLKAILDDVKKLSKCASTSVNLQEFGYENTTKGTFL